MKHRYVVSYGPDAEGAAIAVGQAINALVGEAGDVVLEPRTRPGIGIGATQGTTGPEGWEPGRALVVGRAAETAFLNRVEG